MKETTYKLPLDRRHQGVKPTGRGQRRRSVTRGGGEEEKTVACLLVTISVYAAGSDIVHNVYCGSSLLSLLSVTER